MNGIEKTSKNSIKVIAYYVAENINLKQFKIDFKGKIISSSSSDLFYLLEDDGLLYLTNYGVASFARVPQLEATNLLRLLHNYCTNPIQEDINDDFLIKLQEDQNPVFDFDEVSVNKISLDLIKVIMFNLAQSVALDFYSQVADRLIEEVNKFNLQLEKFGKVHFSKKNMLKFIGRNLVTKNMIIENLYIFDVPDIVWDDRYLDKIHSGMVKMFDLRSRFKEIESSFRNIEENLSIFLEVYQHRMSNILEWIIIVLILIEVIDLFVTKILK